MLAAGLGPRTALCANGFVFCAIHKANVTVARIIKRHHCLLGSGRYIRKRTNVPKLALGELTGTQTFQILGSREGAETPLPAALPLFATGLGALGLIGWRRKRKAQAVARSKTPDQISERPPRGGLLFAPFAFRFA